MGRRLRGQDSALILALVRVLCVSRDCSRRLLEDFLRVLWQVAQILDDLKPQSRSAGGYVEELAWSGFGSDFGSRSGPVRFS